VLTLATTLPGCGKAPEPPAKAPPEVTVARPVEREVLDNVPFTGRIEAIETVEVRARVSGYLQKVFFKPGSEVKGPPAPAATAAGITGALSSRAGLTPLVGASALEAEKNEGDLLFQIDPRPYQAELDKAEGQVVLYAAKLERLEREYDRSKLLVAQRAISPQELDKAAGDRDEAVGGLRAAKANVETYRLNLAFTRITAPIGGRVGRSFIDVGNLVKADSTLLTNIVARNKVYAYFDVDENMVLRLERDVREGKVKANGKALVLLRQANESGFPHRGTVDFLESQLHRGTGTLEVRALFPNDDGILKPGAFVDIRVPVGEPAKALCIPEKAVGSDQGDKYVYVVDQDNKVAYRRVKLGGVQDDGMQVVKEGLTPTDWIVVNGLQRVRDGVTVRRVEEKKTN
jgi:RND family efflux transporter MFP subunit